MKTVILGRTGICVNFNGFGALPVQRVAEGDAVYLLQKAFYGGINFFDTARYYTDSEKKLGMAFEHIRNRLVIATKTGAQNAEGFRQLVTDIVTDAAQLPEQAATTEESSVTAAK